MYEQYWYFPDLPLILEILLLVMNVKLVYFSINIPNLCITSSPGNERLFNYGEFSSAIDSSLHLRKCMSLTVTFRESLVNYRECLI